MGQLPDPGDSVLCSAIENLSEAAAIVDDASRLLWANRAYLETFSHIEVDAKAGSHSRFALQTDLLRRAKPALDREGVWRGEIQVTGRDGEEVALLASISGVSDVDADGPNGAWLVLLTDITRQRQYMLHLETLIQRDSLTGLLNREGFRDRVLNAMFRCRAAGQRLVVLFLDLDGFKAVNDAHGHEVGDRVLVQVGERLERLAREFESGIDVARLGGDEFAVLVTASDNPESDAEQVAVEILRELQSPFAPPAESHLISASIGGRVGPFDNESASELLHAADLAMYEVKRSSGRSFLIQTGSSESEEADRVLKVDFEHPQQRQQLDVHLQPIVDLGTGEIIVLEARVRFRERSGRQFSAGDVLRAASNPDSYLMLDLTVLERAVDVLDRLQQRNMAASPVAVNISVATCTTPSSIDRLESFLARSEVSPDTLRLEFPMEAFLVSPGRMLDLTQRLRKLRFEIMVDHVDTLDFSRARLDQVSLRGIKLHERLVAATPGDKASEDRIANICSVAQQSGLLVGAEGIVRLEQLKFLREAGCLEGQGDLVSKPRELADLEFLLKRGRCW